MRKPKLVLVRWVDAIGPDGEGWTKTSAFRGEQATRADVETAGFLLHKDRHWVRIALSYDAPAENVNGVMQIPCALIVSITELCPRSGSAC